MTDNPQDAAAHARPALSPSRSPLEGPGLGGIIAARLEAVEKHGHTPEADGRIPVETMAAHTQNFGQRPRDLTIPGERQNLKVAYQNALKTAALWWATADRIALEIKRNPIVQYVDENACSQSPETPTQEGLPL